jgi:hypothetical protein
MKKLKIKNKKNKKNVSYGAFISDGPNREVIILFGAF